MRSLICNFLYTKLSLLVAILLSSGCANLNSIYRSESLSVVAPQVISIDAKQRLLLSNPAKSDSEQPTFARFCAEPPPDVFSALAASLGAEADIAKGTNPQIAAKLAATISENAATIERTQTVNTLREVMYRNCERFLSGAITEEEFIVQAARDQQLIVQVLAVEQITGVARAQSSALTTVARAAASGVSDSSLNTLKDAKNDVETKRAVSKKAAKDAAELPPKGSCGAKPIDEANPPSGTTADQAKTKNLKCAEADSAAVQTKEAEEYFSLVKETVAKQGAVSSEAQGQLATAALTASAANEKIAEKVVQIVRQYQAFDEIGMTCVVKLRTAKSQQDFENLKFCEDILRQIAKTREAELKALEQTYKLERVAAIKASMAAASETAAEVVWKMLGMKVTENGLAALEKEAKLKIGATHRTRLLAAKSDFEKFAKAFRKLGVDQQEKLAAAATQ